MTTCWGQRHRKLRLTAALSFAYQLALLVPLPWSPSPADPEEICCSPWWYHRYLRTGHPNLPVAAGRNKEVIGSNWEVSSDLICKLWRIVQNTHTLRGPSLLGWLPQWNVCKDFEILSFGYFHYSTRREEVMGCSAWKESWARVLSSVCCQLPFFFSQCLHLLYKGGTSFQFWCTWSLLPWTWDVCWTPDPIH